MKKTLLTLSIAMAVLSAAQAAKQPNLLILFTDDQTPSTLRCYDETCPIETPNIDRLAEQGVRFTEAFVTTPICNVSRGCLIAGRYAANTRMHRFDTPLPDDVFADSYPAHLKQAGYFLGILGKYGFLNTKKEAETFDVFEAQCAQGPKFRMYKGKKMHDAEWLTVKTEEFLDAVPEGQPFCLQVNYKEPHASSDPAPEDDHLLDDHVFERSPTDTKEANELLPEFVRKSFLWRCYVACFNRNGDHNAWQRQYYEKVASVERSVGQIREMLAERGLDKNTVIIFLSDHGTHFGERQLYGKWTPYEQSLRIPFIVYDPRKGAEQGTVVSDKMVLSIDVAPTLLDLAGVDPEKTEMDGVSLLPLIEPTTSNSQQTTSPWRTSFNYEHFNSPATSLYIPRNEGMRTENMKYARWIDMNPPVEEVYDLSKDPWETNNLVNNPEYAPVVDQLRADFDAWRAENPENYDYNSYGKRSEAWAQEIDWDRFKAAKPEIYAKIKTEVERLGVTWEQAMDDWEIRWKICSRTGYWY